MDLDKVFSQSVFNCRQITQELYSNEKYSFPEDQKFLQLLFSNLYVKF